jgi:hypothetical protein
MKRCILPLAATTREAKWIGLGTGFVVGIADGSRTALVMTAAHVLKYATTLDPYLRRSVSLPGLVAPEPPSLGSTTVFAMLEILVSQRGMYPAETTAPVSASMTKRAFVPNLPALVSIS